MLHKSGYEVELAENGMEVLKKIKLQRFEVILMDVQIPSMDGLKATQAIRKQNGFQPISCP